MEHQHLPQNQHPHQPPALAPAPHSARQPFSSSSSPTAITGGDALNSTGPTGPTVAATAASPAITPPSKRRRTSTSNVMSGCRTCRLRKVKCSGNPGSGPCTNCARLELTCPFAQASALTLSDAVSRTTPSQSHTEAGTLRKRAQRACRQCHSQKTKCSGDLPRCKRCEAGGMDCEYVPAKRKFANVRLEPPAKVEEGLTSPFGVSPTKGSKSASASPVSESSKGSPTFPLAIDTSRLTSEDLLVRKNFLLQHLDAFFENLYWMPCLGFLHPQTAYDQVYDGTFDAPTATAICAVSSFFVNPTKSGQDFAAKCSDEIDFFVFRNIHKFSERVLVPYALNLSYSFLKGAFAKVWQCFGLAVRLMTGLQLNWDVSRNKTFAQQETMRRIAWQFFCMDRLLAGGFEEYVACRAENMKIRLPCNETAFWENKPIVVERLHDKAIKSNSIGLHGLNVRITDLSHRIQAWSKRLTARAPLEPSKVMEDINAFQNELTRFHSVIPDELRLSDQSIAKYIGSQERVGYVYLHTHLSVCHIELYRFALPGILSSSKNNILQKLPKDFVERSKKQAVAHALCTGRFCVAIQEASERLPPSSQIKLAGDCTITTMATQSLRVFLIAMEHRLYDRITDDTTAPLWRFQPPDESHIRYLITEGLFKVSEPYCALLSICNKTHTSNMAMMSQFDKTRRFIDERGTAGFSGPPLNVNKLPGPHYIFENANSGVPEQDKRTRATEAAAATRWFRETKASPSSPLGSVSGGAFTPPGSEYEMEYDPPGVPLFLAAARAYDREPSNGDGGSGGDSDMMDAYDQYRHASMHAPPDKTWLGDGMVPMVNLNEAPDAADTTIMFPPPHFMPPQPGVYMGNYPPQYTDVASTPGQRIGGPSPTAAYIPHHPGYT